MARLTQILHGLGPAMPHPQPAEVLRAGLGAVVGLGLTALLLWALHGMPGDLLRQSLLIAPFGASTYLIFAVPNSPLAQPWSVVLGNTVSALAALAVLQFGLSQGIAAPVAVGVAVLAMAACRAMHPPGGAVALATVLMASPEHLPPLGFAFATVAFGSGCLVLTGIAWNQITGRAYPFRQPASAVPLPARDLSLPADLLTRTLSRLRLDTNLGTEDLARLIEAAESEALTRRLGPITAGQVMTADPVSVAPDAPLSELVALFRLHSFKTLPIRRADGGFGGLVAQTALVGVADPELTAAALASTPVPTVPKTAPLAELIHLIAIEHHQLVAVTTGQTLLGLITRSDLIAVLSGHRHR